MKKSLLILTAVLYFNSIYSQVLYTENFDSYNTGYLGTDPTGAVPGQGGWLTMSLYTQTNAFFTIVNETGRGKVFNMSTGLSPKEYLYVEKEISKPTFDSRNPGNDVLMFEVDYYTGVKQLLGISHIMLSSRAGVESYVLREVWFDKSNSNGPLWPLPINFNTWIKIIIYIDYPNNKTYTHYPDLNKVFVYDIVPYSTSTNLIQEYPITHISFDGLDMQIKNPV